MKHLFFSLKHKAEVILQNNTATKGRPFGFQIIVATLFTIDVVAFIVFCILKMISG